MVGAINFLTCSQLGNEKLEGRTNYSAIAVRQTVFENWASIFNHETLNTVENDAILWKKLM